MNIILCYGEIDLRVAFYRLLYLSKKFDNIDYLIKFYVESLEKKHANFQKDLNEEFKVKVNIFFKEITPPTNINGELPKNLDDLNKIMKNNEFPTLGNKIERAIWNKRLNDAISKSSIKKYFLTIPKSGYNSKGLINEKFSDNHHFTDDIYLQLCQKNFLQQIEKVILL